MFLTLLKFMLTKIRDRDICCDLLFLLSYLLVNKAVGTNIMGTWPVDNLSS